MGPRRCGAMSHNHPAIHGPAQLLHVVIATVGAANSREFVQITCAAYLYSLSSYLYSTRMINSSDQRPSARAGALAEDLRSLVGKLKRRLREQATQGDLTPSQVSILLRLEKDGPATVSSLARSEKMRPQSMSTAVAVLQAAGLVSGAPDPEDGRQTILSLTKACRDRIRVGRAARQDWLSRTISTRLSLREQDELTAAVSLLKRLVDD